jgi:hypothetical protein
MTTAFSVSTARQHRGIECLAASPLDHIETTTAFYMTA